MHYQEKHPLRWKTKIKILDYFCKLIGVRIGSVEPHDYSKKPEWVIEELKEERRLRSLGRRLYLKRIFK